MFFKRHDFSPGDRVVVVAWSLRGVHGTLIRQDPLAVEREKGMGR